MDSHLYTWRLEQAGNASERAWEKWLDHVSALVGVDNLDGDRSATNPSPDAYCLDELFDWYRENWSPARASATIRRRMVAS